jgi:hypothetical protein
MGLGRLLMQMAAVAQTSLSRGRRVGLASLPAPNRNRSQVHPEGNSSDRQAASSAALVRRRLRKNGARDQRERHSAKHWAH